MRTGRVDDDGGDDGKDDLDDLKSGLDEKMNELRQPGGCDGGGGRRIVQRWPKAKPKQVGVVG